MPANSPPSLPDRGGADSDTTSTASETSYHSRSQRRHRREKRLVPVKLDLLIFKSTDSRADVTYTIWRFDIQSWLEQYTEESMMPHVYASLKGYPGCWLHSLEGREHLILTKLLQHMDRAFGEMSEVDTMIRSMYKIRQMEKETVEEYMLHIHEAVVVIQHVYPERLTNQDKNFLHDCFYNGLLPSLHEALGFAVADLPGREQTCTTFDTLYTLARKMEARQSNHDSSGAPSDGYRDRYRQYPTPANRVATVGEGGDFLPPDLEEQEPELPGDDPLDGLSTRMTQVIEPLPVGRASLLHLRADWPLCKGMSTQGCISYLAETVKLPRDRSASRGTCPKEPITPSCEEESIAVNAWVVGAGNSTSLFVDGPTTNWLGPEAVVKLVVEGCEVNTLADSGSQVNTVTPEFVTQNGRPVLPLEDLVDHPLHLVGLGGNRMQPLGFVILRVQVKEITGYNEDVVFLIIPDGTDFSK